MHDGQYRKGTKVPYVVHPVLVAFTVSSYTLDDDIVAAALLHDLLEDCAVTVEDLEKKFGKKIAHLVEEVSFLDSEIPNLSWKEKKSLYVRKIESNSKESLIIIAADKINNMKAYFEALKVDPSKVKSLFRATSEEYYWYYKAVGEILEKTLHGEEIVAVYFAQLNTIKNESAG